jgi:hypothetical protein
MANTPCRSICWMPLWNKDREGVGLEHLLLAECLADGVVLAFDEEHGPFRLTYLYNAHISYEKLNATLGESDRKGWRLYRVRKPQSAILFQYCCLQQALFCLS